jgi:hypothetical protein
VLVVTHGVHCCSIESLGKVWDEPPNDTKVLQDFELYISLIITKQFNPGNILPASSAHLPSPLGYGHCSCCRTMSFIKKTETWDWSLHTPLLPLLRSVPKSINAIHTSDILLIYRTKSYLKTRFLSSSIPPMNESIHLEIFIFFLVPMTLFSFNRLAIPSLCPCLLYFVQSSAFRPRLSKQLTSTFSWLRSSSSIPRYL